MLCAFRLSSPLAQLLLCITRFGQTTSLHFTYFPSSTISCLISPNILFPLSLLSLKKKKTKESIFTAEGIVSLWATLTTDMELYVSSYRRCTYFQLSFAFFDFERMFFKTLTKGQQNS